MQRIRYEWLDILRGLTILSMVAYHGMWDEVYLFGADVPWFEEWPAFLWQQSIAWSFIFLSGFCLPLARRPIRRGAVVFAASLAVTAGTLAFSPDGPIIFGVLSFLGAAMMLAGLVRRFIRRIPARTGAALSFAAFLLSYHVPHGYLGFGSARLTLPDVLYHGLPMTFLGFRDADFFSLDYFPLLPWLFLFLSGLFTCLALEAAGRLPLLRGRSFGVGQLGRVSLPIYLLHQPALYGAMLFVQEMEKNFVC